MTMKNTVEFLGYYGSDVVIAQSAWTSTVRDLTPEKLARVPALLVDLWSKGHETPFEKGEVHFLVDTEIATHIHLLKHRIASINAESARYKELKEDKYYIPEDWKGFFPSGDGLPMLEWGQILEELSTYTNLLYHRCIEDLTPVLGRKRAKESARFFKMYNSQIQADVKFNLRSFANFLRLRKSEHAQLEVRVLAQEMFDLVNNLEDKPFKTALWVIDTANQLWNEYQPIMEQRIKELAKEQL
jgi:flavin-dependent thymidylate synthase